MKKYGCQAYQEADQMRCESCDLTWDISDQNPPKCLTNTQRKLRRLNLIRKELCETKNN